MRIATAVLALLLSIPARAAQAQYLSLGGPVRIELAERPLTLIDGTLTGITNDSIFISRPHHGDVRLARGSVKALYMSSDDGDMATAGAVTGLPIGLLLGGVGGALIAGPRAAGRVLGGVVGALAGGIVGLIAGGEMGSHERIHHWISVPWPSTPLTAPAAP